MRLHMTLRRITTRPLGLNIVSSIPPHCAVHAKTPQNSKIYPNRFLAEVLSAFAWTSVFTTSPPGVRSRLEFLVEFEVLGHANLSTGGDQMPHVGVRLKFRNFASVRIKM